MMMMGSFSLPIISLLLPLVLLQIAAAAFNVTASNLDQKLPQNMKNHRSGAIHSFFGQGCSYIYFWARMPMNYCHYPCPKLRRSKSPKKRRRSINLVFFLSYCKNGAFPFLRFGQVFSHFCKSLTLPLPKKLLILGATC